MKNIKNKLSIAFISMTLPMGVTIQARPFAGISRIGATKAQAALSTVKSNVSALQAGTAATALAVTGAAATSGINLSAIASAASSVDPTIAIFGAGVAAGAHYGGSLMSCHLHQFKQQELATQKAIVSPETAQISKANEFIAIISPKTPSQLKNIFDTVNDYILKHKKSKDSTNGTSSINDQEKAHQASILNKNYLKNNYLPAAVVSSTPIIAGAAIAGSSAFVDGVLCGAGSTLGYALYNAVSKLKQYKQDQAAAKKQSPSLQLPAVNQPLQLSAPSDPKK